MANDMNQCNFTGRLGQEVEVKYMPSGDPVANLRVAVGKQWKDKQSGQKQEATNWFTCVAFGKTAELAQQYLGKGDQVRLTCEASERKWQDQSGNNRTTIEFVIREMQFLGKAGGGQQGQQQGGGYGGQQQAPQTPGQQGRALYQGNQQGQQQQQQQQQPDPGSFDDFDDEIPW